MIDDIPYTPTKRIPHDDWERLLFRDAIVTDLACWAGLGLPLHVDVEFDPSEDGEWPISVSLANQPFDLRTILDRTVIHGTAWLAEATYPTRVKVMVHFPIQPHVPFDHLQDSTYGPLIEWEEPSA